MAIDKRISLTQQNDEAGEEGCKLTIATQLDEVLVVVEADAIVRPHAVMIHDKNTLVAYGAVVCAEWLDEVALAAEGVLLGW